MDRNLEQPNNEFSILGKKFRSRGWCLGFGIILAVGLCALVVGKQWHFFFIFLLSVVAVQYPALYFLLVALLLIVSVIGILRSDKIDNAKLFYSSAFLFCLSIIGGILYLDLRKDHLNGR